MGERRGVFGGRRLRRKSIINVWFFCFILIFKYWKSWCKLVFFLEGHLFEKRRAFYLELAPKKFLLRCKSRSYVNILLINVRFEVVSFFNRFYYQFLSNKKKFKFFFFFFVSWEIFIFLFFGIGSGKRGFLEEEGFFVSGGREKTGFWVGRGEEGREVEGCGARVWILIHF